MIFWRTTAPKEVKRSNKLFLRDICGWISSQAQLHTLSKMRMKCIISVFMEDEVAWCLKKIKAAESPGSDWIINNATKELSQAIIKLIT